MIIINVWSDRAKSKIFKDKRNLCKRMPQNKIMTVMIMMECWMCVLVLTNEILMIKLTKMAIRIFFPLQYKEHLNWFEKTQHFFGVAPEIKGVHYRPSLFFFLAEASWRRSRRKKFFLAAFYIWLFLTLLEKKKHAHQNSLTVGILGNFHS